MEYIQTVVLALVQGLTEFLPISSSAHLILIPQTLGWSDQGLVFDVAVHFGSLLAVIWYFRTELAKMAIGCGQFLTKRRYNSDVDLVVKLALATLPIAIIGTFVNSVADPPWRSVTVIAFATILFGIILGGADWLARRRSQQPLDDFKSVSLVYAVAIGGAQIFALLPGASRSGVTITCALLLGLSRVNASRFSFLLAIPTITAAFVLVAYDAWRLELSIDWVHFMLGMVVSGTSAFLCIHAFIRLVERIGMMPFVIYRVLLGVVMLRFL